MAVVGEGVAWGAQLLKDYPPPLETRVVLEWGITELSQEGQVTLKHPYTGQEIVWVYQDAPRGCAWPVEASAVEAALLAWDTKHIPLAADVRTPRTAGRWRWQW